MAAICRELEGTAVTPPSKDTVPVYTTEVGTTPTWRAYDLDCPFDGLPVEGYGLVIEQKSESRAAYWIDSVHFTPQWRVHIGPGDRR